MAGTLSDKIFQALAKDILSGALAPGQRLDEPSICRKFGVSRTPIREALRRLSGTNLVDSAPRKGVTVARIDVEQLTDMIEARAELEGLCARLSAMRMTALEKKQLEMLNVEIQKKIVAGDQHYPKLNDEFHGFIYRGSHSHSIATVTASFRDRLAPFQPLQFILGRTEFSFREHDRIVAEIVAGNADEAYRAMRDHVTSAGLRIIDYFSRRNAAMKAERPTLPPRKPGLAPVPQLSR